MTYKKELKPGYKNSLFGPIPEDWEVKRLEELTTEFKSGVGITSERIAETGPIPVFGGNGLRGFSNSYTHEGHYILIGRQGALCGNIQRVNGKNYISEHAIAVKTNVDNDLDFLGYKLEFKNLNKLSESSAQPGLSVEKLIRLKIDVPPLPEQTAIANCLSTWDKAIATTSELIAQKEQRKKWLMQQLLTGKKRVKSQHHRLEGLKDFTENSQTEKIIEIQKSVEIRDADNGEGFGEWKEIHLGELFVERNETKQTGLPLLSVGAQGIYPQSDSIKKDTSNEDKSKYLRICPGDIGYNTMRMWQGRSALSALEGIISPAYTVVTPKGNTNSEYFAYLFQIKRVIHDFWSHSQGLVDDTLNCKFKDFAQVKVFVPTTKAEQTAIAAILQKADDELALLRQKLEALKAQKKGLMQVLLTGKKRLKIK